MDEGFFAYHITSIDCDCDFDGMSYSIYDRLTHNEITSNEAILEITQGCFVSDDFKEFVHYANVLVMGDSDDGKYRLTYDRYTGIFDVWEIA